MAVAARAAAVACLLVVGLAAVAGVDGATASSPAPAPAVDCTAEALKLADCLDYVTPGKTAPSRPSKLCCGEVKGALKDSAAVGCLCAAFTSKTLPLPINITRALHLPAACGADASAFSKCLGQSPFCFFFLFTLLCWVSKFTNLYVQNYTLNFKSYFTFITKSF
jgi:hypothetical protein